MTRGQAFCFLLGVWHEYVEEAEHQEGDEYWNLFEGLQDFAQDFAKYLDGREWDSERDRNLPTLNSFNEAVADFQYRDVEYMT